MPGEKDLLDRIKSMEARLAALEARGASGLSGTDQTIKGSHDRLDSILGAGKASPDGTLVTSLNADLLDGIHAANIDAHTLDTYHAAGLGAHANRIRFVATKTVADNTATSVIRITTPNPSGDADAGGYSVYVHCLAQVGVISNINTCARSCTAMFARTMIRTGVGVSSAVVAIATTASADSTAATRTIGTLTVSTVEVDEYNVDVQVTVDETGTDPTAEIHVVVAIDLLWYTFSPAPTVAAV